MRERIVVLALSALSACASGPLSPRGHLPAVPKAGASKVKEPTSLAGHVALARGQRALARGEYALAESELLRAVQALPGESAVRLALAEVWLMLGLAERRPVLLEKAKEAISGALLLSEDEPRAKDIAQLIDEALPQVPGVP